MKADYRKYNDGSHSSSTYHKKDGTSVRSILKNELQKELDFYQLIHTGNIDKNILTFDL